MRHFIITSILFVLCSPIFGADFDRLGNWIGQESGIVEVDIAFEDGRRFVAATRLADDKLKLFAFSVEGGVIEHLDSQAMNVLVTNVKIEHFGRVLGREIFLTATRNSANRLRVDAFECVFRRSWTANPDEAGHLIRRKVDTHSEGSWTAIPKEGGHQVRRNLMRLSHDTGRRVSSIRMNLPWST